MYWLFSLNNSFLRQFEHDLEVQCSDGGPGAVILPMLKLQGAPREFCSVFLSALPYLAALSFSCWRPAYCFCLWKREMEWKHGVVVVNTVWELLVQGRWYIKKTWPWCLANERRRGRGTCETPVLHLQPEMNGWETVFRDIWGLWCCDCCFIIINGSKSSFNWAEANNCAQPNIQLALGIVMKYVPRQPNYSPSLLKSKATGLWLLL